MYLISEDSKFPLVRKPIGESNGRRKRDDPVYGDRARLLYFLN
jgi:hypothetical protein